MTDARFLHPELTKQDLKTAFSAVKTCIVKVAAFAEYTSTTPMTTMNGFFYTSSEPYILTSAHIKANNPVVIRVYFEDDSVHDLIEVQTGEEKTNDNRVLWEPDLALFRCSKHISKGLLLPAGASIKLGMSAYIMCFTDWDVNEPDINTKHDYMSLNNTRTIHYKQSMVSSLTLNCLTLNRLSEARNFGSPVIDGDGYLIGMVKATHDEINKVYVIPAHVIDFWLTSIARVQGLPDGCDVY